MSRFPGGFTEADIDFQGVALIVKFYSVAMNQLLAFLISKSSFFLSAVITMVVTVSLSC